MWPRLRGNAGKAPRGAEGSRDVRAPDKEPEMNTIRLTQLLEKAFRATRSSYTEAGCGG